MAITTYSELKTAVATWLDRSDLTSQMGDFIALFEAKANRRLRVRQQMATATLTPSAGAAALPADYLEWRRVTWTGSPSRELEYVEPDYLYAAYPNADSGTPRMFTIEGGNIVIRPTDTTDLQLLYYEKIDALSDSTTTNWLLTAHPDAYMWGTLFEATAAAVSVEAAVGWATRLETAFAEIERLSQASRGQAMVRPYGATP